MIANLLHRLKNLDISAWEPMKGLRDIEIVTGTTIQSMSAPDYQQWLDSIAEDGEIILPPNKSEGDTISVRIPVCDRFVCEDQLREAYQFFAGVKDMKGWNKPEFVQARDSILGPKKQKRVDRFVTRGRMMPAQKELQRRLDAQYRWKRNRFADVESIDPHAQSETSDRQRALTNAILSNEAGPVQQ